MSLTHKPSHKCGSPRGEYGRVGTVKPLNKNKNKNNQQTTNNHHHNNNNCCHAHIFSLDSELVSRSLNSSKLPPEVASAARVRSGHHLPETKSSTGMAGRKTSSSTEDLYP